MTMREGERWICSNPECGCQVCVLTAARTGDGTNPQCVCGSRMRKAYAPPSFRQIGPDEQKTIGEGFGSAVR